LLLLALLLAGGCAVYRAGVWRGNAMGAAGEGTAMPYAPYAYHWGYPGRGSCLFGLALFAGLGILFLVLAAGGRFFRHWAWNSAGRPVPPGSEGPSGEDWPRWYPPRGWRRHHWHCGPCWGSPGEQAAAEGKPEAGESAAGEPFDAKLQE
jgi:hypothetical protein